MSNKVVSIIVIVIIVVAGFFLFRNEGVAPTGINQDAIPVEPDGGIGDTQPDREYVVTAENFSFSPATMTAKVGDMVRITFKNTEGTHDLVIDELGLNTGITTAGEEVVVDFVVLNSGSFEYYCSVGQHREMGMVGTLVVEK